MGSALQAKEREIDGMKATIHFSTNVRQLCSRVQTILRGQRKRKPKRSVVISAPFNLKCEPVSLPGISEDEISLLRDKAAASRIGVADPAMPGAPTLASSLFSHPVQSPPMAMIQPPPGRPSISANTV